VSVVGDPAAASGTARPSRAAIWRMAIRPRTLPAAVGTVLVGLGVALADGVFVVLPAAAALAVALLLQVAANLANDLFDFRSGADAADRLGPPRTAALGLLGQRELAIGILIVVAAAALVGLYLVSVGGLPILVLGLLAIVSALGYTGGPWPYGYRGLGEVFVFVWFGLVAVAGTTYLQTGRLEPLAIVAAVPVGALITAILVVNNLRDIASDRRAGKLTLAVRLGERGTVGEYLVLLGVAFAAPVAAIVAGAYPTVLLAWLTAPIALGLIARVRAGGDPRRLNPVLAGTALLSLRFSALFALGLAIGGLDSLAGIALP
jgi:1,4-dihydroxy-2-naphthoate octaprenyltransferase